MVPRQFRKTSGKSWIDNKTIHFGAKRTVSWAIVGNDIPGTTCLGKDAPRKAKLLLLSSSSSSWAVCWSTEEKKFSSNRIELLIKIFREIYLVSLWRLLQKTPNKHSNVDFHQYPSRQIWKIWGLLFLFVTSIRLVDKNVPSHLKKYVNIYVELSLLKLTGNT